MSKEVMTFYSWGGEQTGKDTLPPISARKALAPYWKDLPLYHGEGDEERVKDGTANRKNVYLGLKHCMPYFDAMTMGYHFQLHTDVYVLRDANGLPQMKWDSPHHPISPRGLHEMPVPHGHYQAHFSWQMYWGVQPPEGYGALLTHPLNRYDLPFTTVAGYVDFDKYPMPGNVSFHVKDYFEGVIPAGTPIMSMIPIKRESWESELRIDHEYFIEKYKIMEEKETVPMAHYKKGYRVGLDYK